MPEAEASATQAEPSTFTILGAGLVGALLATTLARRGHRLQVFERLPDMRQEPVAAGRSINLALSERGLEALRQVGLAAEAKAHAIPMRGRMMHALDGRLSFQPYGKDDSQCIHSISRGWLNRLLLSAAEATERVQLHFGERLESLDLDTGELQFRDSRDRRHRLTAERLLATDGAGSLVRRTMAQRPGFAQREELLSHGYKELALPAKHGRHQLEVHALHIWPRGSHMLIALPNADGSFTCTLFLAQEPPAEGGMSFASLAAPAAVERFFEAQYGDALALIPDLADQFFQNPTGIMGTVKCAPWNAGSRALLLGDAAHAVVPFYGQGMNCGFEDCAAFDRLLAASGWDAACAGFGPLRKPNADAIADMAVENFVEMRDKTADPRFLLEKGVERQLLRAFPGEFLSRYALVSFSTAPYRLAYDIGVLAQAIVTELSIGLAAPEAVDLSRAQALIAARLTPFLSEHRHELGS